MQSFRWWRALVMAICVFSLCYSTFSCDDRNDVLSDLKNLGNVSSGNLWPRLRKMTMTHDEYCHYFCSMLNILHGSLFSLSQWSFLCLVILMIKAAWRRRACGDFCRLLQYAWRRTSCSHLTSDLIPERLFCLWLMQWKMLGNEKLSHFSESEREALYLPEECEVTWWPRKPEAVKRLGVLKSAVTQSWNHLLSIIGNSIGRRTLKEAVKTDHAGVMKYSLPRDATWWKYWQSLDFKWRPDLKETSCLTGNHCDYSRVDSSVWERNCYSISSGNLLIKSGSDTLHYPTPFSH